MGAWVVLLSLIFAIGTRATPAEAAPITANLPTMSITLNDLDPTHNTLAYVHGDKDRVVPSLVGIEDGAGTYNLAASAAEFKGRGNYTWGLPKKPYQIKFNSSTAILGMPKAKAWVLLANDADGSLMRNKLAFDYASLSVLLTLRKVVGSISSSMASTWATTWLPKRSRSRPTESN